eukprot:CAMPEP_0171789118 /NCGR_PEP_ID=MMETSP0991-20121206/64901_1 /TAXON_ID=483369 /ORGANISM="non described non described, Strain CCMP2098" /LENGTH=283 /DNA_ID=CAMNT_0012398391 /DNA_START=168 /DNA_END=1015 /DNA_ORIENTATION=+
MRSLQIRPSHLPQTELPHLPLPDDARTACMRAACFFAASALRVAGEGEGSLPRRMGGSFESERPGRREGPPPDDDEDKAVLSPIEEEEAEEEEEGRPKKREAEFERRDSDVGRGVPSPLLNSPLAWTLLRGDAVSRPEEPTGLDPRERGAGAASRPARARIGLPSRAALNVEDTLRAAGPADTDDDGEDGFTPPLLLLLLLPLLPALLLLLLAMEEMAAAAATPASMVLGRPSAAPAPAAPPFGLVAGAGTLTLSFEVPRELVPDWRIRMKLRMLLLDDDGGG